MNYLSVKNLSKNYGDKSLFEDISFGLNKGDKSALIARNGAGKSTLLKIIAGKEFPDEGEVVISKEVRMGYLPQEPSFDPEQTVNDLLYGANSEILAVIREYEEALQQSSANHTRQAEQRLEAASAKMDMMQAWDHERRLKQMFTRFNINEFDKKIGVLSGGQRKRLALALTLLDEPDLLLLDEPTNHLDIEMIEWLEETLRQSNITLLMVTHDRYFLDRVCNHIIEIADSTLYHYNGNYSYFLEKKAEREELRSIEAEKAKKLMKKELEWIRRQPKARTTKSKARIDAFEDIKKKAGSVSTEKEIKLETISQRLGGKILELKNITKSYGDNTIISGFEYTFLKGERIGIIGKNGAGKSTLLNIITGAEEPDEGSVIVGETVVFGYYRQDGLPVYRDDQKVIEVVKEIADVIHTEKGKSLTASQFLNYFLFPPQKQNDYIVNLSGGEKRRLYLLTVLIKNPNFLILDEPTNDLDLVTLYKLEEFLMNYKGCLLIVSHDRYFLEKLSDHLFIFEENGKIKDFYGPYKEYRQKLSLKEKTEEKEKKVTKNKIEKKQVKKKLSYKEQKEYETLETEIAELEEKKKKLEEELNSGITDYEKLQAISEEINTLIEKIELKTLRWMELEELKEQLEK
jgi:ATP-binding cassette subfamily F protein uup